MMEKKGKTKPAAIDWELAIDTSVRDETEWGRKMRITIIKEFFENTLEMIYFAELK